MPLEGKALTLAALLIRAASSAGYPVSSNTLVASYIFFIVIFAFPRCSLSVLVAITVVLPA